MGIRNYDITYPATSDELRRQVADTIGRSAASSNITVEVSETEADIPAAEPLTSLQFSIAAMRNREGALRVLGTPLGHEGTVNVFISANGEEPATLTLATPD